jgi:hypothetical protein
LPEATARASSAESQVFMDLGSPPTTPTPEAAQRDSMSQRPSGGLGGTFAMRMMGKPSSCSDCRGIEGLPEMLIGDRGLASAVE